jgi:hypothetical protein
MTDVLPSARRFRVRTLHADDHHGYVVAELSFEAAAVAYLEDRPIFTDEHDEIRVIVRDLESGHEHCFRIDLETGETAPCG